MSWPKEIPAERYPSDLTDEEWKIIEPLLKRLDPYKTGRPMKHDLREILNAIFYLNKTGCPWRYLPKDFPHYTVISYRGWAVTSSYPTSCVAANRNHG